MPSRSRVDTFEEARSFFEGHTYSWPLLLALYPESSNALARRPDRESPRDSWSVDSPGLSLQGRYRLPMSQPHRHNRRRVRRTSSILDSQVQRLKWSWRSTPLIKGPHTTTC